MKKKFSGKQILRAGEFLRSPSFPQDEEKFLEAMDVLSYWRLCHEQPLELAFLKLQEIAIKKDKNALFAKRLKRYVSIAKKLQRYEKMSLKNMQDIGGCRVIVENEKKLRQIVRDLRKQPEFKTSGGNIRSKNYIAKPKPDGYRSYHLIGRFVAKNSEPRSIEVQIRTNIQHYWATALEIVDLFTDQALKSNQGGKIWKRFFVNVSKQFHLMESIHLFEKLAPKEQFSKYAEVLHTKKGDYLKSCSQAQNDCQVLDVMRGLRAYSASLQVMEEGLKESSGSGFVLLEVNVKKGQLKWTLFESDNNTEAEQAYLESEKASVGMQGMVVALVSTSAVGDIKDAYPNFFADSSKFIHYLGMVRDVPISNHGGAISRILKSAGFK